MRCNLRCPMCPRTHGSYTKGDLPPELVYKVLDEMAAGGDLVFLYGLGEPLLDPHIFDYIAACRERGLTSLLSTNATLLDEEAAHRILDAGTDHLLIGVDGATPETYARYRPGGDLEAVRRNVARFLDIKVRRRSPIFVAIQMIRLAGNHHEVPAFIREWRARPGVDAVRIKEEDIGLAGTATTAPDGDLRRNPCHLLYRGPMVVRYTGLVYPCYAGAETFPPVGDVRRQSIQEIWNGPGMARMREIHARGRSSEVPECAACASPRPRRPFVAASLVVRSAFLRRIIPLAERAALQYRLGWSERRRRKL